VVIEAAVTIWALDVELVPVWVLLMAAVPLEAVVPEAEQPARVRARAKAATEKVLLNLRMVGSFEGVGKVGGVLVWKAGAGSGSGCQPHAVPERPVPAVGGQVRVQCRHAGGELGDPGRPHTVLPEVPVQRSGGGS
jgi:hypothetical protein